MKASDLRVGNYVAVTAVYNDKVIEMITKVNSLDVTGQIEWEIGSSPVHQQDIDRHIEYYDSVNGIPLTEEWLLKFGFKGDGYFVLNCIELGTVDDDFISCFWTVRIGKTFSDKIKYVHQLQNLYHALTSEELTTKEDEKVSG